MSEHPPPRVMERHCEVAVIGGSAAGLAVAMPLGRQRRSVIVIDAGTARHEPEIRVSGDVGRDVACPDQLIAAGRSEARSYGTEVLAARAVRVTRHDQRLRVHLTGGHTVIARRVVAATGTVEELPDIEGLAQHKGHDVVCSPFTHGYEVRDQRIVVNLTHPSELQLAELYRQLSARLTLVVHGDVAVGESQLDVFRADGVVVVGGTARRLVTDASDRVVGLELADGTTVEADVIAVGPRFHARIEPFVALGLQTRHHPGGLGDIVAVDANGCTDVPGLYAAGSITDPNADALSAAAHGSRVGAAICRDLAHEDLVATARVSGNEADWDSRYSGEPLWSGLPNGALVVEASALTPGAALDVGAGEGGDALWLAAQGWTVTASDISQSVLSRVAAVAAARGVAIRTLRVDANARDAFPVAAFDLVCAQYASIPRTPDLRGVQSILAAVAPGGTLVVVSHDLEPVRHQPDLDLDSRPFDGDAFVTVGDFAAALAASESWDVQVNEKRPRPSGAVSAHHIDDIVLRARRR